MKKSGPITKNGIHPISSQRVIPKGTAGATKESTPKPAQVAAAGASKEKGGHTAKPGETSKTLVAGQAAEVKSGGSTAEERKGDVSSKFYPKVLGLRGRSSV